MHREELAKAYVSALTDRDHWEGAANEARIRYEEAQAKVWELELQLFGSPNVEPVVTMPAPVPARRTRPTRYHNKRLGKPTHRARMIAFARKHKGEQYTLVELAKAMSIPPNTLRNSKTVGRFDGLIARVPNVTPVTFEVL